MHTVCLLGSPRRECNSDTMANCFLEEAKTHGASVKRYALSELQYSGCQNLFRCKTDLEHCGLVDDLTPVLHEIAEAQVLVLASPIYFTNISGQLKLAIDRFFSFFVPDYPNARKKSRLSPNRHVILFQTQGEPEDKYTRILSDYSASFKWLGFENLHHIRACDTRHPGEISQHQDILQDCKDTATRIYSRN